MEQAQWELDQLLKLQKELAESDSDRKLIHDKRIEQLKQIIRMGK